MQINFSDTNPFPNSNLNTVREYLLNLFNFYSNFIYFKFFTQKKLWNEK